MITIKKSKKYIIIGLLSIVVGSLIIFYPCFNKVYHIYQDNSKIEDFFKEEQPPSPHVPLEEPVQENIKPSNNLDNYIAILEIPSISLKKGLVDIHSKQNHVNKNIQIMPSSMMPNKEKSNLILAGHSGSGYNAFFRYLHRVKVKDFIYVYYQKVKYIYRVVDRYEEVKNGTITIHRNRDRTTLTLTTCSPENRSKQLIIIAELVDHDIYY